MLVWLLLAALLLSPRALPAQTRGDLPADKVREIERIVAAEMGRAKIPGLSLAIVVEKKIQYVNGFGLADLENFVPASSTTVFRIASLTKTITATAVLQLAERGRLDLDAPIQRYCPAYSEKQWPVTARQLLGHLGGVRNYKDETEARGTAHYARIADALNVFKDDALLHEPGTKFAYSNFGYVLLGCAIEEASGQTYQDYLREHIFRPVGMTRTRPDHTFEIIPNRARGYVHVTPELAALLAARFPEWAGAFGRVGEVYNAQLHDTSIKRPAGGLVSTAAELARFAVALESGQLVKPETLREMWTTQRTRSGEETGWGLGWILPKEMAGEKAVRISGNQPGASAALVILPDKQFAVAVLANLEGVDLYPLVTELGRLWKHFPGKLAP